MKDYKKCLKASRILNIKNYLKRREIDVDCLKEDKKELIMKRIILKMQLTFKSVTHNVFTEEINKIVSKSNDNKRTQSIDSIKTYAHEMSKELV